MEGAVTALFLLACLLGTASVGTGVYDRRVSRRLARRDGLRQMARLLHMEIDVEAPDDRWQRLHTLAGVRRRVSLEPDGGSRIALTVDLRRTARVPFLARRWQGPNRQIELIEGRVLAAEALLEPRLQRAVADGPGQRASVELTHERVVLVFDVAPRSATALHRHLDQAAAIAELVERRIERIDAAEAHPARVLGFLPTATPSGPTRSWPVHGPHGVRGTLVLSDAGVSLDCDDETRFVSLERPFVVVMSRSHDVSGEPLLHVELRQDDEGPQTHWTRLEVSARTRSFAASIEGLPEQGHRAPFLAEAAMQELLARVRAASAAHGVPLDRDTIGG